LLICIVKKKLNKKKVFGFSCFTAQILPRSRVIRWPRILPLPERNRHLILTFPKLSNEVPDTTSVLKLHIWLKIESGNRFESSGKVTFICYRRNTRWYHKIKCETPSVSLIVISIMYHLVPTPESFEILRFNVYLVHSKVGFWAPQHPSTAVSFLSFFFI
jgi:hypothetical protein